MVGRANEALRMGRGAPLRNRLVLLALAAVLAWAGQAPSAAPKPAAPKETEADQLFRQERWAEARAAYDAYARSGWHGREFRDAIRGAVRASLKLKDWMGALERASKLIYPSPDDADEDRFDSGSNLKDDPKWQARLSEIESNRELVGEILRSAETSSGDFATRLTALRIAVDQSLLRHLDPPRHGRHWGWSSGLPHIGWWWDDVPEAEEYIQSDERYSRYRWEVGIALDGKGQPIFLEPPKEYTSTLPRSKKLLFVLREIEQLDNSPRRNAAGAALLAQARLMRRLYGPQTDGAWSSANFYYRYDKRPSFVPSRSPTGIKEMWELADDEARTNIGEQSRVIKLPDAHSPLALLARLERDCPQCDSLPGALHERAQYYQTRRQFAKALEAYRREIQQFPNDPLTEKSWSQIGRIEHADVILGKTGIYAMGTPPKLWFACRNAGQVEFRARRFDLEGSFAPSDEGSPRTWFSWHGFSRFFGEEDEKSLKQLGKWVGQEVATWTQPVERSDRVATHSTAAPLTEAGAYLVEAQVPGSDQRSRGLVIVTGIAIVQKPLADRVLLWLVDSRNGNPLVNQKVRVVEQGRSESQPRRDVVLTSDQRGVCEYRRGGDEERRHGGFLFASAEGRGATFCELADQGYDYRRRREREMLVMTDRPLYRPDSTVNFRVWVRDLLNRRYLRPEAGIKLHVAVRGPHYSSIRTLNLETDESGCATGSFHIGSEASLGEYQIQVEAGDDRHNSHAGEFRVEEFKKPEFEVTVTPAKRIARSGEPISTLVEARYYFGLPVSGGDVAFKIYREELRKPSALPAEFDWLYGTGYGVPSSPPARDEDDDDDELDWAYRGWYRRASREKVGEGHTRLDAQGRAEIRFDSAGKKPPRDRDWRYVIEVHVRDEARRTVAGSGSIEASRQEFLIFAELDRGWYAPGDTIVAEFNARSSNNVPVAVEGQAALLLEEQPDAGRSKALPVQEWKVATGADGRHTLRLTAPRAGRYRLELRTRDSADRDVSAAVSFWVYGGTAELRLSRPQALEIIPHRRSYAVGQTARLLVVTAAAEAHVMLCQGNNDPQFLMTTAGKAQIFEVPITENEVPNLFVEGTLVHDGAVHTRTCQLFVPPVRDLLKIEMTARQPVQKPGESGKFKISVTDNDGQPVAGDLALTAFDKAITYIQPESGAGPKSFIRSRREERYWTRGIASTLDSRQFGTSGSFMCPEFYVTDDYVPAIGMLGGAVAGGGDPSDADKAAGNADDRPGMEDLPGGEPVAPKIRSDFSDAALWQPHLTIDDSGRAEAEIKFPESLTTWRLRGYLVTNDTRVGEVVHDVVTSKDLLVRLQRPRFLVERDEVVLSANVHNNLQSAKTVVAELLVPAALFRAEGGAAPDSEGNVRLTAEARVGSGEEHRFDWPLTVVADGLATVTVRALTDEQSDAMRTAFPIRTHATPVFQNQTGAFRAEQAGEKTLAFEIPEDADPRKTRIALSLAPSPASAAFEAIPYLAGYPYGCVEQTMSRFYPTVLAARTLKTLGIDVSALTEKSRRVRSPSFGRRSPEAILDTAELERMTEAGLQRLERFQHDDGGWGWWEHDQSSPFMTAYVIVGLYVAAESGLKVEEYAYDRALSYLTKLDEQKAPQANAHLPAAAHTRMFVTYALALERPASFRGLEQNERDEIQKVLAKRLERAFTESQALPLYDRILLALASRKQMPERSTAILKEILEKVRADDETDTAHVPVGARQSWHSWNSEIETNAWLLRALVAIDRENPIIPKLVNWLVLNRQHGRFWRSTQDTALCVTAIAEYLAATRAAAAEQTVEVRLDKRPARKIQIARGDVLGIEILLDESADRPLEPGRHELTIGRNGTAPLHYALQTEVYRTIALGVAQGSGLTIARRYFRLGSPQASIVGSPAKDSTDQNAERTSPRLPLAMDDVLAAGELVEVELGITADEDYEYVAFEDMKPAGCEPVQLQSGSTYGNDLWANVELRDDRVVFFAGHLRKGAHLLRYRLRAETPGRFHALPARGFAMYAPEIQAQSDELRLRVAD